MYLSLDGCLSPEAFLRLVGYFKHYNRVLLLLSCLITLMMISAPLPESYRRAIDSDNKSHLPMGWR